MARLGAALLLLLHLLLHRPGAGEAPCLGFSCGDGRCVAAGAACDGTSDCSDGSDEAEDEVMMKCLTKCKKDEFLCSNRRCVSPSSRCDGVDDCGDGSDEALCTDCVSGSVFCAPSGRCLPRAGVCDGTEDCPDGEDERDEACGGATTPPGPCRASEFRCRSGQCVAHSWRCDHTEDCADGSDEEDCEGHDECRVNNGGCSHHCVDQPLGVLCDCPENMRLIGDTQCEEIVECLDRDVCDQSCVDVNGNSSCECHRGYVQSPHTGECKAAGDRPVIVVSSPAGLWRVDGVGRAYRSMSAVAGAGAGPVAVLSANRTVYWANAERGIIYRSPLDGNPLKTSKVFLKSPGAVSGLAIDWVHRLLYWTDTGTRSVNVASLDRRGQRLLIGGLVNPSGVAVDPLSDFLFWADSGRSTIERSGLDGRGRRPLVTAAIRSPVALSIDVPRQLLYWADAGTRSISRVDFEGQHRKTAVESNGYLDQPRGLMVFEGHVLWTDEVTRAVCGASKHDGTSLRVLLGSVASPGGLAVVHEVLQPEGRSACGPSGGGCPDPCIPDLFSRTNCQSLVEPGTRGDSQAGTSVRDVPDASFSWILALIVFFSVILVGLVSWWWRSEFGLPRPLGLHGDLKESQDPLMLPGQHESSPVSETV
ncbi:low-density lipoprotein receptor-related protein 8-like isoform X2 [Denticeps clupeoides]|uniref:low-density lipoprotein receptor-related protein 8-like isoform X2 n=1 Tax=Denticeps clupeoides TaxID=299321 RepID=UPI0010A4F68B|nr:low-density lipoprotein receptor-related protein 8-like isoform X2 [Denticeps clupeoides]